MTKTAEYYNSHGLSINHKKTKIIVFNKRGLKLENEGSFYMDGKEIEITDEYQYLGIKLKPSGSMQIASSELTAKANRAWFSMSNIIYKNKKMDIKKVFQLFDSLVSSVFNYASEMWLPFIIPKKCYKSKESLINFWESFEAEKINLKCCRMILSVHRKCSRVAILGELSRYPTFLKSLSQCLNYKLFLQSQSPPDSLVSLAMSEMSQMADSGQDCWLTRVRQMESLLGGPGLSSHSRQSGKITNKFINSLFERTWLDKVNEVRLGPDGIDHNKLRTYRTFKGSFTTEPYLTLVRNRNQRQYLTRFRVSASNLDIERLRYTNVPVTSRTCRFCDHLYFNSDLKPIDDERHFFQCEQFENKLNCLRLKITSLLPNFINMNNEQQFSTLMCPTTPQTAKIVNKFIKIIFDSRDRISNGQDPNDIFLNL